MQQQIGQVPVRIELVKILEESAKYFLEIFQKLHSDLDFQSLSTTLRLDKCSSELEKAKLIILFAKDNKLFNLLIRNSQEFVDGDLSGAIQVSKLFELHFNLLISNIILVSDISIYGDNFLDGLNDDIKTLNNFLVTFFKPGSLKDLLTIAKMFNNLAYDDEGLSDDGFKFINLYRNGRVDRTVFFAEYPQDLFNDLLKSKAFKPIYVLILHMLYCILYDSNATPYISLGEYREEKGQYFSVTIASSVEINSESISRLEKLVESFGGNHRNDYKNGFHYFVINLPNIQVIYPDELDTGKLSGQGAISATIDEDAEV